MTKTWPLVIRNSPLRQVRLKPPPAAEWEEEAEVWVAWVEVWAVAEWVAAWVACPPKKQPVAAVFLAARRRSPNPIPS
jgi:hypothetical protein